MTFLKALCISFSIYSKIPVPIFEWKENELRYHLIFFPWIGAVIGALLMLWTWVSARFAVCQTAYVLVMTAIPILVTGGFHIDGFMDTTDALRSYKTREEKLDILKDPHIGAFSVIMLAALGLIFIAALAQTDAVYIPLLAGSFFLSRTLSGLAVVLFPSAKKDGMLSEFNKTAKNTAKKTVVTTLLIQLAACGAYLIIMDTIAGGVMLAAAALTFIYYRQKSLREFGGITGDTAGWFVVVCETVCVVCTAVCSTVISALF